MPSVRGRERMLVAALLGVASATTGAVVGFFAGAGWAALLGPSLNAPALATLLAGCLLLDAAPIAPLSVLRQVPQLWGRIFAAPTVAVLYGARLGVGPLTILRTWLWWAMLIAGASAGPWWSAGVGAAFGAARIAVMLAVGTRAGAQRARERAAAVVLAVGVVVVLAALVLLRVGDDDGSTRADAAGPERFAALPSAPTTTERTSPPASISPPPVEPVPLDAELGAALPEVLLPGWTRSPDDRARRLGPLDLAAAAAAEDDTPAERALLETRHFVRGHARAWRGPGGQVGYASLYEFASPADAEAYLVDGITTIEARGARVYDVEAPPGGRGFSQAERGGREEASTVSHGVVFVRGARFALVFVSGRDSSVDAGDAAAAATAVASAAGA